MERVANDDQFSIIAEAVHYLAKYGEATSRIRKVAALDLTFEAIMHEVYVAQQRNPAITDHVMWNFRKALHIERRKAVNAPVSRTMLDMFDRQIARASQDKKVSRVLYKPETICADSQMSDVRVNVRVPTDDRGMCYPKPNGGHRILPSIYTRIREWWMRANGVTVQVQDMNDGHLENTMKLLHESHGNLIARSTELLGKMANHFHRDKVIVAKLEDLCREMQRVDVDDLYPIFKDLATEAAQRKGTPAMLVAIDPGWFSDGELDWSNN